MWACKRCVGVILLLFLSIFSLAITLLPENVSATTRYVGGSGPGNYTTIQAAIDDADTGDTVYVFNGTYYEHVKVNKTLSLVGEDSNTTFVDASWVDDAIYVSADWVNITGFTVTHSGTDLYDAGIELVFAENCTLTANIARENARGFNLAHSHGNTLYDNAVTGNRDYGIYAYFSTYNTITGNNISGSGNGIHLDDSDNDAVVRNIVSYNHIGIRITDSKNITIDHNKAVDNFDWGIYLFYSSMILVRDNNVSNNLVGVYARSLANSIISNNSVVNNEDDGVYLFDSTNVTIKDNNASNNKNGIMVSYTSPALIVGNTISSNSWSGIALFQSSRFTILGNNVSFNDWGVWAEACLNMTFTGNAFHNDGIFLMGNVISNFNSHTITSDNHVDDLPIYYHKNGNDVVVDSIPVGQLIVVNYTNVVIANLTIGYTDAGIEMAFVDDAIITGSNLSSNEKMGVYVYYSVNITVKASDFSHNGVGVRLIGSNVIVTNNSASSNKYGIQINSYEVSVVGNNISGNVGGIRVDNSSALTITDNSVFSNINFGIRLLGSTNITVYHNNIVNNTIQAVDGAGNQNSWDDGYPSAGNYWSDYMGLDDCSGPNQDNCPDPDGIGDTPYVIDADSQDRYPLMLPVEKAFPRAPSDLQITLSGSALENITLTWSLSPDDGAGNQLVTEYAIWRGTIHNPGGSGYEFIASLPNGTSEFTDVMVGEGNPNSYYYRVCAVDSRNNTACAENQAGKFTHLLSQGPNLISIPLIQLNESIEYVLQTVDYNKAWFYDSSSQEWKWHMKSKGYRRGLWNVNQTMGLWVNVTGDWSLTVAGLVPAQTMIHLHSGWNLVGFPSSNTTYTVADLKADTGATRVEGLETMPPFPPHYLRVLGDADMLLAGEAYWVKVDADTIWTVEMS